MNLEASMNGEAGAEWETGIENTIHRWADCYISVAGDRIIAGNDRLERVWSTAGGWPESLSLLDKARGEEWLAAVGEAALGDAGIGGAGVRSAETGNAMLDEAGMIGAAAGRLTAIRVDCREDGDCGLSRPHLRADADMRLPGDGRILRLSLWLYPQASFMRQQYTLLAAKSEAASELSLKALPSPAQSDESPLAVAAPPSIAVIALDANNREAANLGALPCIERFALRELHTRWESVRLSDRTDTTNNLVARERGLLFVNERRALRGNALLLGGTLRSCGLLLLKEGPAHAARPDEPDDDYRFVGLRLESLDAHWDLAGAGEAVGCALMVGVHDGTEYGAYSLLHAYHRAVRVFRPELDAYVMSNTWGDRSKDSRVTDAFIAGELRAAAALGIDICQIDDGWQNGVTVNSVLAKSSGDGRWGDYYSGGGDFWSVHPERFPQGFGPTVALAARLGVRLGLWYSPDATDDYALWRRDARTLLELHGSYGINHFKLDGIDLGSSTGKRRLLQLMRTVVTESLGAVRFNLDMTAQRRLGYYADGPFGSLFLENRYTDWRNYYPHWTLRNLWSLAPYVPVQSLQAEFLNVNRNRELYGDDPLSPYACGQAYTFGVTAFASPLAWMELSSLDEVQASLLSSLLHALRPHRAEIASGHILPLGDEPSGTGWTGLQSIAAHANAAANADAAADPAAESGYLLIVRERSAAPAKTYRLWGRTAGELRIHTVARLRERDIMDAGSKQEFGIQADDRGEFTFTLPAPLTFAIYKYEKN
ncbi:hypothetical protein COHCIP112018_03877 [Cohnella sp. JJ-181]|nr:hypothetical protein COHCIP112018_03877 [Cohnella sp. JJ-181]